MDDNEPWVFLPEADPVPELPPETAREVIRWWERRRLKYNLLVIGLYIAGTFVTIILYPGYAKRIGVEPEWNMVGLFAAMHLVLAFIVSNVCYTAGWISHLVAKAILRDRVSRFGSVAYTVGMVFSVLLVSTLFILNTVDMISGTPPNH